MANTWCDKVFHYCFLIMCVLQNIDYTRADDDKPVVNYGEMNSLITNARSVSLNGNTYHLDEWLPRIVKDKKVKEEINLIIMYTFVKCECAHLIRNILANKLKPISLPSQLHSLNAEIKRAITVLFLISDLYPTVQKIGEPYFLKTLLMTSFYIDYVPSESDTLDDTNRTLLQIINLFERFTIEYCPIGQDGKDNRDFDDRLRDLSKFLNSIVYLNTDPPYLINMSDIKLVRCIHYYISPYKNKKLASFCENILSLAQSSTTNNYILYAMFDEIEFSYDIELIYDYMLEVYNAILTLLYNVTRWALSPVLNKGKPLDVEWCSEKISELKSRNFPIEIINNIELALRVEHYKPNLIYNELESTSLYLDIRKDNLLKIFMLQTKNKSNFDFKKDCVRKLTLSDLMDNILGMEFQYFWWVFNLLHKVFEKKSVLIDVTALNKFPPITYDIKCDDLTIVYHQSICIEETNKDCIAKNSIASNTQCSETVCSLVLQFSEILLKQMNKWNFKNNYTFYDELGWITLAAISNLNKFNECKSDMNLVQNKEELISKIHEPLKRILDVLINALEYHQITKCENIINRECVTANNSDSLVIPKKTSIVDSIKQSVTKCFSPILVGIRKHNYYSLKILTAEDSIMKPESFADITYFDWHGEVKSLRRIQSDISDNILDIHDLVEYQKLYLYQTIYIYYTMWLNILDRIFRPQTDEDVMELQNKNGEESNLEQFLLDDKYRATFELALDWLLKIIKIIFQTPLRYQIYKSRIALFKYVALRRKTLTRAQMIELAEVVILNPTIKLLGVVEKDEENRGIMIATIQQLTGINGSMDDFEKLFAFIERNNYKTIRDFIYEYGKTAYHRPMYWAVAYKGKGVQVLPESIEDDIIRDHQ